MSRNGSGVYSLPAGNPVVTGTTISSSWANTTLSDIATALTGSVAADGQTAMTGNLQMGGNKVTGLGVATTSGDALSYAQAATISALTVTGNATVGGTLTLTGGLTLNGNVTVGDSSSDTLTVNATSTFAAGATFSSTFAANGGATLGDASGDALTINSSAVSIPNGLNFDSNTFVIDATNNRVGVGTASPSQRLHIAFAGTLTSLVESTSNGARALGTYSALTSGGSSTSLTLGSYADGGDVQQVTATGQLYINSGTSQPLIFSTNATERMRITSTGNVGIGTSSPAGKLQIAQTNNTTLNGGAYINLGKSENGVGGYHLIGMGYNAGSNYAPAYMGYVETANNAGTAGDLVFFTRPSGNADTVAPTERMRLDSSGNLGLGVTPSAWSDGKALQVGTTTSLFFDGFGSTYFGNNFYYNSGFKYTSSSKNAVAYLTTDNGQHIWYNAPSGTAGNAITFTQAMTLTDIGRLGLGITSPAVNLHVYGATNADQYWDAGGTVRGYAQANTSNATFAFGTTTNHPTVFLINGTERMRIDSSGNLLVAQTSQSQTGLGFSVVGSGGGVNSGTVSCGLNSSSSSQVTYVAYSTSAAAYRFYVDMTGTVHATNTTITGISDVRLKENIRDLDDGLDVIMALKPRKFDWKEGKGQNIKNARGFIAQEFEQVLPDMVEEWRDPAPEGEDPYKAVNANLIPTLVKALQELNAKVTALEAQLNK